MLGYQAVLSTQEAKVYTNFEGKYLIHIELENYGSMACSQSNLRIRASALPTQATIPPSTTPSKAAGQIVVPETA